MNWLTPLAGLWLALAVIPPLIILYFLKLRRRPQAISCTILWKRAVEDLRANAPFQRLRKSLLLFLQLIALALLIMSIMQPQLHAGRQEGGKTVILIDNSASMSSTNVSSDRNEETRLDEAKQRARELIESIYRGGIFAGTSEETMIVSFSDQAEIVARFTDSKQQLLTAIDRIQPTHGETRIADALKLARAYTTNIVDAETGEFRTSGTPPTIELFSDGRVADVSEHVLRSERLVYHAIGQPEADNVAIPAISVQRPYDRQDAVEVFVALANYNREPVTCDIQLSVDDRARGIEETEVAAATYDPATREFVPGRANVVFTPFELPRGAVIELANLREDDLAADNVANIVVPPPTRLTIGLVTESSSRSIIRRALEGLALERLNVLSPAQFKSQVEQGAIDSYDVVVFDNVKADALPPGRYLSFGPTPAIEGLNEFGEGAGQIVLSVKDDHPVLRYVSYDNIFISKFHLLQPAKDVQVLMEGSRGPAMVAVSRGPMQLIHCPFDPLESNWPFQRSFVTFLFNAIDFLGHAGEAIASQGLKPGDVITARLPSAARDIRILAPGRDNPIPISLVESSQVAWGPAWKTGLYVLEWKTPDADDVRRRAFAVNLLSESEGRLDANHQVEFGTEIIESRPSKDAAYTPMWPWAIGLCLAVLMLEWWIYHRKAFF